MPFSARDAWLAKEAAKKKDAGESPTPTETTSNKAPLPFQSQEKARANLASNKDLGPEDMYGTGSSIVPESFRQPFVPSMKQRYPGPTAADSPPAPAPKAETAPAKTPAPKAPTKLKKQTAYYDDDEPSNPQNAANKPPARTKTPSRPAQDLARPAPQPKPDQYAEIRADLLANAKADAAAKAAAERKRKEAEEFSSKLKSTTRKGGNKTGYDAYKSLMGE